MHNKMYKSGWSAKNQTVSGQKMVVHVYIPPFYFCADPYVICADILLRMRGKFTIICAFQLRDFLITFTGNPDIKQLTCT